MAQPVITGRPGLTVSIDESVVAPAKPGNGCGRRVPPQWVFGGVELGSGTFFMELATRSPSCPSSSVTYVQEHGSGATSGALMHS